MQIKVNDKPVEVFAGARVEDALRRFSKTAWRQVQRSRKRVYDGHGHEVALDGELNGGEELFIHSAAPAKHEP